MDDPHAFRREKPFQIESFAVECTADLARAVVRDPLAATAAAAIGDIELVPVAPRPACGSSVALEVHVAAAEVVFDEARSGFL